MHTLFFCLKIAEYEDEYADENEDDYIVDESGAAYNPGGGLPRDKLPPRRSDERPGKNRDNANNNNNNNPGSCMFMHFFVLC